MQQGLEHFLKSILSTIVVITSAVSTFFVTEINPHQPDNKNTQVIEERKVTENKNTEVNNPKKANLSSSTTNVHPSNSVTQPTLKIADTPDTNKKQDTITKISSSSQSLQTPVFSSVPINGVCGSSNNKILSYTPSNNLCSSGLASFVAGTGPWGWTCAGINGGKNASCNADTAYAISPPKIVTPSTNDSNVQEAQPTLSPEAVNGACGSANLVARTSPPTTNLCAVGVASTVSGEGPWNWTCAGTNGGLFASCAAPIPSTRH